MSLSISSRVYPTAAPIFAIGKHVWRPAENATHVGSFDDDHTSRLGIDRKLNVAATSMTPASTPRSRCHAVLIFTVSQRHRWATVTNHRYAHRVDVLDRADHDDVVFAVA